MMTDAVKGCIEIWFNLTRKFDERFKDDESEDHYRIQYH
jgi:hypothetical protein